MGKYSCQEWCVFLLFSCSLSWEAFFLTYMRWLTIYTCVVLSNLHTWLVSCRCLSNIIDCFSFSTNFETDPSTFGSFTLCLCEGMESKDLYVYGCMILVLAFASPFLRAQMLWFSCADFGSGTHSGPALLPGETSCIYLIWAGCHITFVGIATPSIRACRGFSSTYNMLPCLHIY